MSTSKIFSARDYQHKRFRSRGGDTSGAESQGSSGHPSSTIDASTPRIVTPPHSSTSAAAPIVMDFGGMGSIPRKITLDDTDDNHSASARMSSIGSTDEPFNAHMRQMVAHHHGAPSSPAKVAPSDSFVHEPTASNSGLSGQSPLKTTEPRRYVLSKESHTSSPQGRRTSDGMSNKLRNAHAMALQKRPGESSRLPSSSLRQQQDSNSSCKIFLLLLQPKSKIFELIQLIYAPNDTTLGQILDMIPDNATEAALGTQEYIGLCRPKTHEELLDREVLASEVRPGIESAKITLGEILVAIPKGYTGPDVAALSKQILANPKIVKLLRRADPLAPKRKKRSSRHRHHHRHSSSSGRRSSSRENVHVLEKHDEAEDEGQTEQAKRKMKKAMEHAAEEAAAANAAIAGTPGGIKFLRSNSITSQRSLDLSMEGSLDESYSSWSKSFDASFSAQSSICSGVSKRAIRRRERQARRMHILQKSAIGAFVFMVLFYMFDPNHDKTMIEEHDHVRESPMGLSGVFQCLFVLLTLYKLERLFGRSAPDGSVYNNGERRCPFLKASATAMKRFKGRYTKRLNRSLANGTLHIGRDDDSISQRLRGFSLKAAAVRDNETDTGSI